MATVVATISLRPAHEVLKSVRGRAVPTTKIIWSVKDKARRNERRLFKQNRRNLID